jgi:hypothetical protein
MLYVLHPTGAFRSDPVLASTTRIVVQRKALVADGLTSPAHYLRIPV